MEVKTNEIKKWQSLMKDLVQAKENNDSYLFNEILEEIDEIECNISNALYNEDDTYGLMDSLIKLVDISEKLLDNPTMITSLQNFQDMYAWDYEKKDLFDMLINDNQRKLFIDSHYDSLFIKIDNFKFVVW